MRPTGGTGRIPFDLSRRLIPQVKRKQVKGLAKQLAECTMAAAEAEASSRAKSVDAFPSYRGRLLPRDAGYVGA